MARNKRYQHPSPKQLFRGYVHPDDALTLGQAARLSDTLLQQRDFYIGEMHLLSRQLPSANGNAPKLKERMQELNSRANALSYIISQEYLSEYSHSTHPDGELCLPLERLLGQLERDTSSSSLAVEIISTAVYDWTKTQRNDGVVYRTHLALNKLKNYARQWEASAPLESRLSPLQPSYS